MPAAMKSRAASRSKTPTLLKSAGKSTPSSKKKTPGPITTASMKKTPQAPKNPRNKTPTRSTSSKSYGGGKKAAPASGASSAGEQHEDEEGADALTVSDDFPSAYYNHADDVDDELFIPGSAPGGSSEQDDDFDVDLAGADRRGQQHATSYMIGLAPGASFIAPLSSLVHSLKKSGCPNHWRPLIQSEHPVYGLSCFFYALIYLTWGDGDVIKAKVPILDHLGIAYLLPPYWFWQAAVSFWADYIDLGRPGWSHLIDTVCAVYGAWLYAYIFIWERHNATFISYAIGIGGVFHAYGSFVMSRYYRRVEPSCENYAWWHTMWHATFPLWTTLWGLYLRTLPEVDPENLPWYPDVWWSFYMPFVLVGCIVWRTRSVASAGPGGSIENTFVDVGGAGGGQTGSFATDAGRTHGKKKRK